jgi:putative membrane protein
LRITLAALHLFALGIGLGAVLTRGSLLRGKIDASVMKLAFRYDTLWGIAALIWITTGLWRWLGSVEKAASYYTSSHIFLTKMACLLIVLGIEVRPAITLVRWRRLIGAGQPAEHVVDATVARSIAIASHVQALLVVIMVFLAAAMARGFSG